MADGRELTEQWKRMVADRRVWDDHWQRLAEIMLPKRAQFNRTWSEGDRRTEEIYDGIPMQAARNLAVQVDGMMKPKTSRWFRIRSDDDEVNQLPEFLAWARDTEDRMFAAIYGRRAKFLQSSGETDLDLVVFGTGALFVGTTRDQNSLLFRAEPLHNVYVMRDADGEVDQVWIRVRMRARQAEQMFGLARLGDQVKDALTGRKPNPMQPFEFVHVIMPRGERNPRLRTNTNMPFASFWLDVPDEHIVSESGFNELPYVVPVWDAAAGEVYGRSPGMIALPDANTLMAMGKTILKAGQKIVDPPLLAASDSVIGPMRTFPGGISYFNAEVAKKLGLMPIQALDTRGNIPVAREMQNDVRDQVWSAFFRNVLNLPTQGPQMTATEIIERKEEFMRVIGPTFGRLESDYTGALVEKTFRIMQRFKALMPLPEGLDGVPLRFEYESPIEKARKQIEATAGLRSAEVLAPYISIKPDMIDNLDTDEITRAVFLANGSPPRWLRDPEVVAQERQRQLEQQQQLLQQEQASQAVDDGAKIAKAIGPEETASALRNIAPGQP